MKTENYSVLLPGINGFKTPEEIIINPSHFIFPAWKDFYRVSHDSRWKNLINDSQSLLRKKKKCVLVNINYQDWVSLCPDGHLPEKKWPARFSFDAIVFLFILAWAQDKLGTTFGELLATI